MQAKNQVKQAPCTSRLEAIRANYQKANRENQKQFNDRLLNYRKKLYCVKQKIPMDNFYDRAFKALNKNILNKISQSTEQHNSNNIDKGNLSFENYPKIYKKSSSMLLKMMKSIKSGHQGDTHEQSLDLLRNIRKIDFKNIIGNDKIIRRDASESRLYDYDERVKSRIIMDRNMSQLTRQADKIVGRIQSNIIHELNNSVRVANNEHRELPHIISKNSYLVSLNYNFKNPLI